MDKKGRGGLPRGKTPLETSVLSHIQYHLFLCSAMRRKYLKSYLTAAGKRFPYRHQLEKLLLPLCVEVDPSFGFIEELLRVLDAYSVDYRYPGESANDQQARRAIQAARNVRRFVRPKLSA